MTEKEIQFRKRRELNDIISDSFQFLKQEIKPLSRLLFIYVLPFIIIYGVVQIYVQRKVFGNIDFSNQDMLMANLGPIYSNVLMISLFSLFVQSLLAGTFYSYIEIYIKKGKGKFALHEITPHLFSNSLLALGANLVLFIMVVMGLILCIVPGIYFGNSLSLVVIILIYEKRGLGNALTRSWSLVHSQWWNTFALNLVAFLIILAVSFVLSIPSMIAGASSSVFSMQETGTLNYPDWYWVAMAISTIISSILWVIPYTFLAFQYFNIDERTKPFQPPV
jgi:hypothetical protein